MALKAIYERAEEIPEAYRALFTERDGRYELTGVAGMKTEADVARLRKSLTDERSARSLRGSRSWRRRLAGISKHRKATRARPMPVRSARPISRMPGSRISSKTA